MSQYVPVADEWQMVRDSLAKAGVQGVEDFGKFVNNTQYFAPSRLDEQAAAPTLLALLPSLREPKVVASAARHLRRPWLRRMAAYDVVLEVFDHWAPLPGETGWVLGDTLATAADKTKAGDLVELAGNKAYGTSRGCIVEALWRFKSQADVESLLRNLVHDSDVALMAMTALQRTIGAQAMVPVLQDLLDNNSDARVRIGAERQLRRITKKLARSG
jgi:HEAT repeat protein